MTTTTLRPSNTISNFSVVVTAGGTTYGVTSDDSDATYMRGTVDKASVAFGLTALGALTASQRIKSVRIRSRTAGDTGVTSVERVTMALGDKNNRIVPQVGYVTVQRGSTAILTTQAGPISYVAPGNLAWTQARVNSLRFAAQWLKPVSGALLFARVHEVYVDVDINEQPIVTGAPVVTNFTNNATPTVTWTYFDLDGDNCAAWRVRLFDAATIAAGNFNAETASAVWDSAQQYGDGASVTVDKPLQNGTTYTAYVKVAQSWPGKEGTLWWSAWSASAPFAVTFVPPTTPTITAAVVQDTNQYRTVFGAVIPMNLLSDDTASIEGSVGQWTGTGAFLVNVSGSPTRDATQAAPSAGSASLRLTSLAAGDMIAGAGLDFLGGPVVGGGSTYTIVASFKAATVGRSVAVGVTWLDKAGATISTVYGTSAADVTTGWVQASATLVAPGNAFAAKATVKVIACGAAGEVHYVDKIDLHLGSAVTWMPGGYRNDQGDLLIERGEYLDDSRGTAENWFHPQVASCGTLLRDAGYGFSVDQTVSSLVWAWLDKTIPEAGWTPAGMLNWKQGGGVTPSIGFGSWFYGGTAYMPPAVANQAHTFSVWAWVNTATFSAAPSIEWRDAAGVLLSTTTGTTVVLTTTPQKISVTGTAPAGAVLANGTVKNTASDNNKHVFFTRAGFGLGTVAVGGRQPKGLATGVLDSGLPAGITWTPIRFSAGSDLMTFQTLSGFPPGVNTGQTETFADYEITPGRPTLYRASIAYSYNNNVLKSAYATVAVYGAPPPVTLLRSTSDPTLACAVNTRKTRTFSTVEDAAVFHPLGSDGAPVKIRDWVGGEDGQLTVITSTEAQSARLTALVHSGDVLVIQWAQGGRTYCVITGRDIAEILSSDVDWCDADGIQMWTRFDAWTVSYLETVAP